MSKEKQIEEMTKHCFFFEDGYCCVDIHKCIFCETAKTECGLYQTLENLYNTGYRKQSEVVHQLFDDLDEFLVFPSEYSMQKYLEIKAKYKGNIRR